MGAGRIGRVLPQLRLQVSDPRLQGGVACLQLGYQALQGIQGRPGFGQGLRARTRK